MREEKAVFNILLCPEGYPSGFLHLRSNRVNLNTIPEVIEDIKQGKMPAGEEKS